jgi:hypothetical protein
MTPSSAAASVTSVGPLVNGKAPAILLHIGRFTEKSAAALADGSRSGAGGSSTLNAGGGGDICSGKIAFKSKVVSRSHAEIWCEPGGKVIHQRHCQTKLMHSVLRARCVE